MLIINEITVPAIISFASFDCFPVPLSIAISPPERVVSDTAKGMKVNSNKWFSDLPNDMKLNSGDITNVIIKPHKAAKILHDLTDIIDLSSFSLPCS
ncbi:hypothetical protein prwr041_24410 [Prevotella herbatica]|uniref:Uncharacterized protein n=1 Tax=Prevotella herbatica TaxID=2801997 RepID=A0ABM7P1A8_9BACT|nr:hypothetical protein prwr041_24410 [Prevotella herbatica]